MALDSNLKALLTTQVNWYPKTGADKFGQDVWAATPTVLLGYPVGGSRQIQRRDGTVYTSTQAIYFDANDANVQTMQAGDKFQSVGIAGGHAMEAAEIATQYSPGPSLNQPMKAWLVEVLL